MVKKVPGQVPDHRTPSGYFSNFIKLSPSGFLCLIMNLVIAFQSVYRLCSPLYVLIIKKEYPYSCEWLRKI
jgi:hypothetical protein